MTASHCCQPLTPHDILEMYVIVQYCFVDSMFTYWLFVVCTFYSSFPNNCFLSMIHAFVKCPCNTCYCDSIVTNNNYNDNVERWLLSLMVSAQHVAAGNVWQCRCWQSRSTWWVWSCTAHEETQQQSRHCQDTTETQSIHFFTFWLAFHFSF